MQAVLGHLRSPKIAWQAARGAATHRPGPAVLGIQPRKGHRAAPGWLCRLRGLSLGQGHSPANPGSSLCLAQGRDRRGSEPGRAREGPRPPLGAGERSAAPT